LNADPTAPLDLWTVRHDGTDLFRVTTADAHDWTPAFSPDGQWLAFASTRLTQAISGAIDEVGNLDIFVVRPDGSDLRFVADVGWQDEDPVFSADSQKIYFVAAAACYQLWSVDMAPNAVAEPLLDNNGSPICGEDPSLSPDGTTLLFWDNQTMGLRGLDLSSGQLSDHSFNAEEPWIGPAGLHFTFISNGNVWTAMLDGSNALPLTSSGDAYFPRWAAP